MRVESESTCKSKVAASQFTFMRCVVWVRRYCRLTVNLPISKYNWLTESYESQNGMCWFDVSSNRSWLCFPSYRSFVSTPSSSSSSSFTSSCSSSSSVSYESWLRLFRHRFAVDAATIADVDDADTAIVICLFCLWLFPFSFIILSAISLLVASSIDDAMWLCLNKCDMCRDEGGVSFGFLFVRFPPMRRRRNIRAEEKWKMKMMKTNDYDYYSVFNSPRNLARMLKYLYMASALRTYPVCAKFDKYWTIILLIMMSCFV